MSTGSRPVAKVCLVAFVGRYTADTVERPRGRSAGRLAVVVLEYQGNEVLGTVVLDRPPQAFGHFHIGP